jgi:AcrR family transcriptional regulator
MPDSQPNRNVRRKKETRNRIIRAAEALMRERGVEPVTIQDITERADVGHGSFYVHFESKSDVLTPIAQEHARTFNERLTRLTGNEPDPALAFAINVRHLIREIANDELWSYFVFRSGLPNEKLREGIGDSGRRDLEVGLASGRFSFEDIQTVTSFLLGALVGVLDDVANELIPSSAFDQAAELVLRVVGLDRTEARALAHRELPPLA